MELLPGDVPAGPRTQTNSNQVQIEQRQNIKRPSQEQKLNFEEFFYVFNNFLGLISWFITFWYFSHNGSNVSPSCPDLMIKGEKYLYEQNFSFDLHAYISENETNFARAGGMVWSNLTYGNQSAFTSSTKVPISGVSLMSPLVIFFYNWILFETKPKCFLFSTPKTKAASTCTSV